MKKIILLILFGTFTFSISAQDYQWVRQYARSGIDVSIEEISESNGGQVIVGGLFEELTFKDFTYTSTTRTSSTLFRNLFVASYNTDGSENWIRTFLSPDDMILLGMDVDASGNIYLLFESGDSVTSLNDTFLQDADPSYYGGYQVIKLDPQGGLVWRNDQFAFSEDLDNRGDRIELSDIAVSPAGELHLAMSFDGEHRLTNGLVFNSYNRDSDPLLIKYQVNGAIAWAIQGDSQWDEQIFEDDKTLDIEIDSENNVLMAGLYISDGSPDVVGLRFGILPRLQPSIRGDGAFLVKVSPTGAALWLKEFSDDRIVHPTGSQHEQITDMVVDGTDILLAINFNDDLVIGSDTLINEDDRGGFPYSGNAIVKLNADGETIWINRIVGGDLFNQIGVDQVNNQYAVLGNYRTATFQGSGIRLDDDRERDFYLALYEANGTLASVDTTEYISNGGITLGEKSPMEYLADGTLITTMRFGGPGSFTTDPNPPPYGQVKLGNVTIDTTFTIMVKVDFNNSPALPSVNLGDDVAQCEGTVILDAGEASNYLWSTGETSRTIEVDTTGTFAVRITDDIGQSATDTILIEIDTPIAFNFPDTLSGLFSLEIVSPKPAESFLWSTGATEDRISVDTSGYYSLQLTTKNGCESVDSVYAEVNSLMVFSGGSGSGNAIGELINDDGFYYGASGSGNAIGELINDSGFYNGGSGSGSNVADLTNLNGFYNGGFGDGGETSELLNVSGFYTGGFGAGTASADLLNINGFYEGGNGSGDFLAETGEFASFFNGGAAAGYAESTLFNEAGFYHGGIGSGYATAAFINQVITEIDQGIRQETFNIYPNPAREFINWKKNADIEFLEVFSLSGALVMRQKINSFQKENQRLDVSSLSRGTYLIVFHTTTNQLHFTKLLKE
ncbi:MAG: T9SS type A sorting domain-containing protein [Bacteroidota bacterium]